MHAWVQIQTLSDLISSEPLHRHTPLYYSTVRIQNKPERAPSEQHCVFLVLHKWALHERPWHHCHSWTVGEKSVMDELPFLCGSYTYVARLCCIPATRVTRGIYSGSALLSLPGNVETGANELLKSHQTFSMNFTTKVKKKTCSNATQYLYTIQQITVNDSTVE